MRKLFALIFVILLFAFSFTCFSAALSEKVEIAFKVGDSTLVINGEEKTVETPYVVGDGVTLVPVRVITEAFGAEVGWISSEKKVTLSYMNKKIELWIGNTDAAVDGNNKELLSAPELTNGVTMVPLRFISENFGADVKYDADTKQIYIIKDPEVVTKEGTYYYESENCGFSAHVPTDFYVGTDEKGFCEMITGIKYRDSLSTVIYSTSAVKNIEEIAKTDKELQMENVISDRVTVKSINKGTMNGIDVVYYQLVDDLRRELVTKAFFNHGSMSYLYLSFSNTLEYDVENGEEIDLNFDKYNITIPAEFQGRVLYRNTEILSSNDVESIAVRVFQKDGKADIKEYLEYNSIVVSSGEYAREFIENEIFEKSYTVMGNDITAYEYKTEGRGVVTRGVIFEIENIIVFVEFVTDFDDESVKYFVENLVFDFENIDAPEFENVDNYKEICDSSKKVVTSEITFKVPKNFDVTYSKDKMLVIAKDKESELVLMTFVNADSIENDDTVKSLVPTAYYGMVEKDVKKTTVSETMSETRNYLSSNLWSPAGDTRRTFSSGDLQSAGVDSTKFRKLKRGTTWSVLNIYQIRTNATVNTKRQKLHAFVFNYTTDNHDYNTMMKLASVIKSVKEA